MYSDASKNPFLGFGALCRHSWVFNQWDPLFIIDKDPSIEYLELYMVAVAVLKWIARFQNRQVILFCDNQSVISMINSNTSSCRNCMVLIRFIVMHSMVFNIRVYATYVKSKDNKYSDALS